MKSLDYSSENVVSKNPPFSEKNLFSPGKLFERVRQVTTLALARKALLPLSVSTHIHPTRKARIHHLESRPPKNFHPPQREQQRSHSPKNPFLPADPNLIVADISPSHLIVLNKFPITLGHILIITREFRHQQAPLESEDFLAIVQVLREIDGMGFFNGGPDAGASQPHRHIQLIPSPPSQFLLYSSLREQLHNPRSKRFPFRYLLFSLDTDKLTGHSAADQLYKNYLYSIQKLQLENSNSYQLKPYNIIITRELMLIVARKVEHYRTISVNSLGFVGDFLCQTEDELQLLLGENPIKILQKVSC